LSGGIFFTGEEDGEWISIQSKTKRWWMEAARIKAISHSEVSAKSLSVAARRTAMIIVQCDGKFIAKKKTFALAYILVSRPEEAEREREEQKKPFSICSGNYQRDWEL
jgi:hypothetical protein